MGETLPPAAVDLYWIPLGAGGHFVRLNGKVYEAVESLLERRPRLDLYHSALVVHAAQARYTIECAWVSSTDANERGVVAAGSVGSAWAGSLRIFRYEVRCWLDGVIPDIMEAIDSPQRLSEDERHARALLELAPQVPTPAWGRDRLGLGEMWNSNSVISWLLARSGIGVESAYLPAGGRAPGWDAGVVAARSGSPTSATSRTPHGRITSER
jgi:hypothetical protein